MNTDCKLIWESYGLLTELTVSKANVQRLITKYGVDEPAARSLIDRFNKVESILAKRDIFAYANLAELDTAINTTKTKNEKIEEGVKVIFENNIVKVLWIKSEAASIKHGRGTKWCISYDSYDEDEEGDDGNAFVRYAISSSVFFVISKTDKEKFAIITNTDGSYKEIKNKNNEEVPIQPILSKYNLRKSIFKYIPYTVQELKNIILSTPDSAIQYAVDVIKGRWPEAESSIMNNPYAAMSYAAYVIKGRWPEAESIIMKDPLAAMEYARDVIKGRWPEAESRIMENPLAAMEYARDVIKRRWPEAESIIMKDSYAAAMYSVHVLKQQV